MDVELRVSRRCKASDHVMSVLSGCEGRQGLVVSWYEAAALVYGCGSSVQLSRFRALEVPFDETRLRTLQKSFARHESGLLATRSLPTQRTLVTSGRGNC